MPRSEWIVSGWLAFGLLAWIAALVGFWRFEWDALDRYLVLVGSGYAAFQIAKVQPASTARPVPLFGLLLVFLGGIGFIAAGFFHQILMNGRTLPIWAGAFSWCAMAGGYGLARFGYAPVRRFAFPAFFALFAIPIPSAILGPLQEILQGITTSASERGLRILGFAVERPGAGFILNLPAGQLGVAEACSGIRSLTALTALAAFVAYRKSFGPMRGALLVLLTLPIVVSVNVLRVILSGIFLERIGPEAIRGVWHETLGFAMVILGLGMIVSVARLIARSTKIHGEAEATSAAAPPSRSGRVPLVAAILLTLLGSLATVVIVRSAGQIAAKAPPPNLEAIPAKIEDWEQFQQYSIPPYIQEMLQPDAAINREYRNGIGRPVFVWVLAWTAADRVRGYHHPDICLMKSGYTEKDRAVETIRPNCGGIIPATARSMRGTPSDLYVLYWTQEGNRIWGPEDEEAAIIGISGRGIWGRFAQLLGSSEDSIPRGRIVVLIGTPNPDDLGKAETLAFTRGIADELYKLCPEAIPALTDGLKK